MASNCINKSSKEFKELQSEVPSLSSNLLAARVAIFQKKNNTDRFPSFNEVFSGEVDKAYKNFTAIYEGEPAFKQVASLEQFVTFSRFYPNDINIDNLKKFVSGQAKPRLIDVEGQVEREADNLAQGKGLTKQEFEEAKNSMSEITDKAVESTSNKVGNKSYDGEGRLSSVTYSVIPGHNRLGKPQNVYSLALRAVNNVNAQLVHVQDNSPVARLIQVSDTQYEVQFTYSLAKAVYRANFDVKDTLVSAKNRVKLFQKKALEQFLLDGLITEEEYLAIKKNKKLDDIQMSLEEMRLDMVKGRATVFAGGVRKGEYVPNLEIGREEESVDYQEDLDTVMDLDARNPVNIDKFREKREKQIKILEKKIEDLSNRRRATGRNKFYTEKIKYFEDILKRFNNELESSDMINDPLKLVRQSFEDDMKVIKEIHQDPNLDNIFLARDLLQTLKNNSADFKEGYDNYFYKENRTLEDVASLTRGLNEKIASLSSEQQTLTTEFFLNLAERYQDTINIYKGLSREQLREKLSEEIADTEAFSRYAGALGKDLITNDLIGKIIRAETDIEEQREISRVAPLAQKLDNMTTKLQGKLKKLGYVLGGKTNWMDAFTRNTEKGDLELVSKFSETWKDFIKSVVFDTRSKVYAHNKNGEYKEANTTLNTKYNRLKDKADFIDFTVLPEIQDNLKDDEFFSGKFNSKDNTYSKELKDRLGEEEYNSLIERQINFLEEYKLKHKDITANFLSERDVDSVEDLSEQELSVLNQRLNLVDPFYFINNQSQNGNSVYFQSEAGNTFARAHTLDYNTFIPKEFDGEGNPTNFFDEKFKKIEQDSDLLEAWKVLEESVFLINSNVAGSSRLNLNKRSILYLERALKDMYLDDNYLLKQTKRFRDFLMQLFQTIRDAMSNRDKVNKDKDLTEVILPSQMKSFKSRVFNAWSTDLQELNTILGDKRVKGKDIIDFTVMNPNKVDQILEVFDLKDLRELLEITGGDLESYRVKDLKKATQKKVYNQQTIDLPSLLKAMLNFSATHKARETANNIITDVVNPGTDAFDYYKGAGNLESKKDFFEKRVIRNDTSKGTWFNFSKEVLEKLGKDGVISFGKIGKLGLNIPLDMYTKNMTSEEKRINRIGRKRLAQLEELKKKINDTKELDKIDAEVSEITNRLGQLGADYTLGNMFESAYIKLFIYAKLGLNFKAAVMNLVQGRQQSLIKAGYLDKNGNLIGDYTSQQFQTADSFSFGMAADRFAGILNKKPSEQNAIAGALIGSLNIIQDGTDIFQRSERTGVSQGPEVNPRKKEFWNAMKTTEIAEYYNQVPIILSVFMNYKMPDGSPMFTGSEFPYHEIKDGVFKIKDEYLDSFEGFTPEQLKAEYETFNSEKALRFRANLKGNILTIRNGDYSNTGVVKAKGSIVGATTMTFSTWVYGLTYSAWAINQSNVLTGKSENGHYVELMLSEKGRAMLLPLMTQNIVTAGLMGAGAMTAFGAVAGASSALIALAPFIIGIGLITLASKRGTNLDTEETGGFIKKATRAITGTTKDTVKLLGHNTLIAPFRPLIEKMLGSYNRRAGKKVDWFNNPKSKISFDYSLGGKLNENESIALRQSSEQQAILQFTTMLMAGITTVIASLGADEEEDEPKNMLGRENPLQKIQDTQRRKDYWWYKMKYISNNMLQQSYQDASINLNPFSTIYSILGDASSSKLVTPGVTTFKFGVDLFSGEKVRNPSHINYGDSKFSQTVRGMVFPSLRNIDKIEDDNWMLGFETLAQKYYTSNPMVNFIEQTDYKKDKKERERERTDIVNKLKDPDELVKFFPENSRQKLKETFFGGEVQAYSRLPIERREMIDELIKSIKEIKAPLLDRGFYGTENQERTSITEIKEAQVQLKSDIVDAVISDNFEENKQKALDKFNKALEKFNNRKKE